MIKIELCNITWKGGWRGKAKKKEEEKQMQEWWGCHFYFSFSSSIILIGRKPALIPHMIYKLDQDRPSKTSGQVFTILYLYINKLKQVDNIASWELITPQSCYKLNSGD